MKKRVLSLFMAFVLCLTLLPAPALAAAADTTEQNAAGTGGVYADGEESKAPEGGNVLLYANTPESGDIGIAPDGIDENGKIGQGDEFTSYYSYSGSEGDETWNTAAIYLIENDVTISGDLTVSPSDGAVCLVLGAGVTLTIEGALILGNDGFYIYGQTSKNGSDTGQIVIKDKDYSEAPIRSSDGNVRVLHICGGKLTAEGTYSYITNNVKLSVENPTTGWTPAGSSENVCTAMKGTLDDKPAALDAWSGTDWVLGKTLVVEYCTHEHSYDFEFIPDTDGTSTHHMRCKVCGFTWASEECFTDAALSDIQSNGEAGHILKCICGREKTENHTEEALSEAVVTLDGKGHVSEACVCGYTSATSEDHKYDADGSCTKCKFQPVFEDGKGNLYDYGGTDSIEELNEVIQNGMTSFKLVNFAQGEGADSTTVSATFELNTDATVTLDMNGKTLTNYGIDPVLTVSGGTLIINGDAVIKGVDGTGGNAAGSAVKVTDGELIFKDTLTATGGSGISAAAPAIEVTGGKVTFEGAVTATGGLQGLAGTGNPMACKPAVYATGGELDFKGSLDLNGGLTVTGDATLTNGLSQGKFRVEYYYTKNGETIKESITTSRALSVEGSSVYNKNVNNLLADKHIFVNLDPNDTKNKYFTASYEYLAWNVTIEGHTHTWAKPESGDNYECKVCGAACAHEGGYATGACAVCGKPCPHPTDVPRDGHVYCGTCGERVYAQIQTDTYEWSFFTDLTDAIAAAENGQTVKLRDDVPVDYKGIDIYKEDSVARTITLDLNYKNITSEGGITVGKLGRYPQPDIISPTTLNIVGNGSILLKYALGVDRKSTLNLEGWTGGTINIITIGKNTDDDAVNEATFKVGKNAGTINRLEFTNWVTDGVANTTLSGGTYGTIELQSFGGKIILGDLLAAGYAFKSTETNALMPYNTQLGNGGSGTFSLTNITVVKCTAHVTEGEDDHCIYCNTALTTEAFPIAVTVGETTARYAAADMQKALDAAADNGTVKLLDDVTFTEGVVVSEQQSLTLDLNGKTLTGDVSSETVLSVEGATVTICDGENNSAGGSIIRTNSQGTGYKNGYVVSAGSLGSSSSLTIKGGAFGQSDDNWALYIAGVNTSVTIEGGKFENQVSANSGTLTITGGTFSSTVFIGNMGSAEISGGTFASLKNGNGTVGTLLADGYGFQWTANSAWLTESELTATSVTNVTAAAAPIHSVTLTANTETVEYGLSKTVKLSFSYERLGGSDPTNVVTTTWYQVKDGVPENFENSSVFYTLPDNLDAGEYTYRITVKDNDSGYIVSSNDIIITVTKADLANAVVVLTNSGNQKTGEWTFYPVMGGKGEGSEFELEIDTITVNGMPVSEGDYAISGNTGTNVGSYTMTAKANANSQNFKGEWTFDWEIVPYKLKAPKCGNAIKKYDGTTDLPADFWDGAKFDAVEEYREIALTKDVDYTVISARYDSPDVGDDKTVYFTIELTNQNYVFANGQSTIECKYSNAVTTGTYKIEKADMQSESMTAGEAYTIVNKLSKTYEIDLAQYLPALAKGCAYGDVTYDQLSVYLPGYYGNGASGAPVAEIKDGKLILPILPNSEPTTGEVGEVQVKVSSANYEDFQLIIKVNAISKIELIGAPTLSKTTLTYGEPLSAITLSGAMKDSTNGSEVTGTFEWLEPDMIPETDVQWVDWKFTPDNIDKYLEITAAGVQITVKEAASGLTAPTAKTLSYTGAAQELVTAGTADNGTMQYSLEKNGTYTQTVPTGMNAGEYTVWYKVVGDKNYTDIAPASVSVTIEPMHLCGVVTPTALEKVYDGTAAIELTSVQFYDPNFKATDIPAECYVLSDVHFNTADVGSDKVLFLTVTLKSSNYVLELVDDTLVTEEVYEFAASNGVGVIRKAPAPAAAAGAVNVSNKHEAEYTVSLADLLPALADGCSYGTINYAAWTVTGLDGYYDAQKASAKLDAATGVLTLPIQAVDSADERVLGTVTVTVETTNYESFVLTVNVSSVNKIVPVGAPTLSKKALTYGELLSAIALSGSMKDGDKEVSGTFVWAEPNAELNAGTHQMGWRFTPADSGTYMEASGTAMVVVNKATPTGAPKYTAVTASGKTLADAALTTEGGTFSVSGTVMWVDADGNALAGDTEVKANTAYKWRFTPTDANNYNDLEGSIKLYSVSTGGGGGTVTPPTTTETETTTDPDGTTTKTETKSDGSTVETVTKPDGSTTTTETKTETKPDGSTTTTETKSETNADGSKTETKSETTTAADGSKTETKSETKVEADGTKSETKAETKTDANGVTSGTETTQTTTPDGSTGTTTTTTENGNSKTEAEAKISEKAVEDAKQSGEAVKVPTEVKAGESSNSAPTVKVELPKDAGETKIEIPVSDVNSGTVAVIVHEDGTEEIVKSSTTTENGLQLKVEGSATIKVIDNSKTFDDTQNHWSRDEVNFVASRELFNGIGNNLFGVSGDMTRGMVNTVLARLAGVDTTTSGGSKWYEAGTAWAKDNGISDGTNPTANVTREQLAAMLYRFAGSPEVSGELNFADADHVSGYAKNALLWAVQNGILNGIGDNLVAPKNNAERAQVAAMMARYLRNL